MSIRAHTLYQAKAVRQVHVAKMLCQQFLLLDLPMLATAIQMSAAIHQHNG
jgi:hypothetical protein